MKQPNGNEWKEIFNLEHTRKEFERCKNSPWYFATKYLTVAGKPFYTNLTEEEFNEKFKKLKNGSYYKSR